MPELSNQKERGEMMYRWDQTDTDSSRRQTANWKLVPLHAPPMSVTPPSMEARLRFSQYPDMVGSFQLVWHSRTTRIDDELHNSLLENGMREYEDIWRSLAAR